MEPGTIRQILSSMEIQEERKFLKSEYNSNRFREVAMRMYCKQYNFIIHSKKGDDFFTVKRLA